MAEKDFICMRAFASDGIEGWISKKKKKKPAPWIYCKMNMCFASYTHTQTRTHLTDGSARKKKTGPKCALDVYASVSFLFRINGRRQNLQ